MHRLTAAVPPAWIVVLVVAAGCTALATSPLPPDAVRYVLYLGLQSGCAAGGAIALVRARPRGLVAGGWWLLVIGLAGYFAADGMWVHYTLSGVDPYPSPADALFVTSTLVMIAGALLLVRARRSTADRFASYDALVLAGALGAVLWTYVVEPSLATADAAPLEMVLGVTYPMLDIALAATISRLVIAGGRVPTSLRLLLVGLVVLTAADAAYYLQELSGAYVEWGWVDAGYMLSYGLMGSALLHPSMARVADDLEQTPPLGRLRLFGLCAGAMTPLLLLVAQELEAGATSVVVLGGTAAALFAVVIVRSWNLVSTVEELTRVRSSRRFEMLVRHSADAIVVIDAEGEVSASSDALTRVWTAPAAGWRRLDDWVHPEDRPRFVAFRQALAAGAHNATSLLKVRLPSPRGVGHAEVVGANLLDDPEVAGLVLTVRDVSERVALESELRRRADRDDLTGLASREVMLRALEQRLAACAATPAADGRVAPTPGVLFLDLDDFKTINDGLGHVAGDDVLVEVARRLREQVPSHALAARLGGDEFAVLVDVRDGIAELREVADGITEALRDPVESSCGSVRITTSIGMSLADGTHDGEALLRNADLAMYEAKRRGKHGIEAFTDDLVDDVLTAVELRAQLVGAAERGELRLVAQPIVPTDSRQPSMFEVLLRWTHPERGEVPPATFVPVAERSGLIDEIGGWVLHHACAFAASISGPGAPSVSVNVSAQQLRGEHFETQLRRALDETGLDARRLVIEITESAMAEPVCRPLIQRLRSRGIRIAVDDFGTGWSSLSLLQHFAVDIIKIDKSFVSRLHDGGTMARTIVELARGLRATTVAEGMEHHTQGVELAAMGCDYLQGYAISRPMELVDFRAWLADLQPAVTGRHDDVDAGVAAVAAVGAASRSIAG